MAQIDDKGRVVIDLEEEKGEKVWMIVTTKYYDRTGTIVTHEGVAMSRDLFGDMTLDEDETLLEQEKFTEEEALEKCKEWSEKLGVPNLSEISLFDFLSGATETKH